MTFPLFSSFLGVRKRPFPVDCLAALLCVVSRPLKSPTKGGGSVSDKHHHVESCFSFTLPVIKVGIAYRANLWCVYLLPRR
jgi:hypothetical protein